MASHSSLKRKLQPAKKALKRFTYKLQSRLTNLSFSKAIRVIKTSTNNLLSYCSRHLFTPFKKRFISKTPSHGPYSYKYNYDQLLHSNFSPIYVEHLYSGERDIRSTYQARHFHAHAETSGGKEVEGNQEAVSREESNAKGREKCPYSVEDAWKEIMARSPQLRPVDERAEEFISKFHQDMKLQKEKSLLEYQEMLARSAS